MYLFVCFLPASWIIQYNVQQQSSVTTWIQCCITLEVFLHRRSSADLETCLWQKPLLITQHKIGCRAGASFTSCARRMTWSGRQTPLLWTKQAIYQRCSHTEITKGFTPTQILTSVLLVVVYTNSESRFSSRRQITVLFCRLVYVLPVHTGTRMRKPQLRSETKIWRRHKSAAATQRDTSHTIRAGLQCATHTNLHNIFISLLSLAL